MSPKTQTEVATAAQTAEQTPERHPARTRTSHACDRCRELRAKCSGGVRCTKCTVDDTQCQYSDRKREHNKKSAHKISNLQDDKQELLEVLMNLVESPDFRPDKHPEVLGLIDKMSPKSQTESPRSGTGSQGPSQSQSKSSRSCETSKTEDAMEDVTDMSTQGESFVNSDVHSSNRLRELPFVVDLGLGTGMTGYVGKMSGMSWLQRVREYLVHISPLGSPDVRSTQIDVHVIDATNLTYFMEDQNLLAMDEDYVRPHQLPPWELALVLSEAYFHSLQGEFCFVQRKSFYSELTVAYKAAAAGGHPSWDRRKYLAMANMMWSVGAKWLELIDLDQRPVPHLGMSAVSECHLMYYARARALGLDHRMQLDHPTIPLVQGIGILAFYLMVNGSIQSAWSLVGQAIRHATALGLHLAVSSEALSSRGLQYRARLWYSLSRLEILLSEITGRPKCIRGSDVTVPLTSLSLGEEVPVIFNYPIEGINPLITWSNFIGLDQGVATGFSRDGIPSKRLGPVGIDTIETQFVAAVQLSLISDKIGSNLYLSPTDLTWADVQDTVRQLELELSRWQVTMSPDANTDEASIDPHSNLDLEMHYCSVQMILYRPFVCETLINNESLVSTEYNRRCAQQCVRSAIRIINIMPDQPVAEQILQVLPWWGLLHYVCQAAAVLLLEMCLNIQHMPGETRDVTAAMRKALNYFWALSPGSKSAYKAWTIFRLLVEKVTQRYQYNVLNDVPQDARKPHFWSNEDDRILYETVVKILH